MVAKNDRAHAALAELFASRQIKKTYIALVQGEMERAKGTINASVGRDPQRRTRMTAKPLGEARTAVTHYEVARRLGVCRWEVHRLEESEKNSRIMLATLSRAAKGLGCELVYALIPKEGALEDLAAEERAASKRVLESKRAERAAEKKPWLEAIGWREKLLGSMRTLLRQEGFRVRPRKTERGVAKQQAEFAQTVKLAGMARVMGPLMSELAGQRAGKPVGERAEE